MNPDNLHIRIFFISSSVLPISAGEMVGDGGKQVMCLFLAFESDFSQSLVKPGAVPIPYYIGNIPYILETI